MTVAMGGIRVVSPEIRIPLVVGPDAVYSHSESYCCAITKGASLSGLYWRAESVLNLPTSQQFARRAVSWPSNSTQQGLSDSGKAYTMSYALRSTTSWEALLNIGHMTTCRWCRLHLHSYSIFSTIFVTIFVTVFVTVSTATTAAYVPWRPT
jgi:hypothetical protein